MDDNKCIICLENTNNLQKCDNCVAYICETCKHEYINVRHNNNCPHCGFNGGIWKNDFVFTDYDLDDLVRYDHVRRLISFTNTNLDYYISPIIQSITKIPNIILIVLSLVLRPFINYGSSSIIMICPIIYSKKNNHYLLSIILIRITNYLNHTYHFGYNLNSIFMSLFYTITIGYIYLKNQKLFLTISSNIISKTIYDNFGQDHYILIGSLFIALYILLQTRYYIDNGIMNHYSLTYVRQIIMINTFNYHILNYLFLNEYSILESVYQIYLNRIDKFNLF